MTSQPDPSDDARQSQQLAALRAELELVRRQSSEDIARLEQDLALARRLPPQSRDPAEVIASTAVEQELLRLRNALREKERIVVQLNGQCRGLEDQLEDRYQQLDGLRRQVDAGEREIATLRRRARDAEQALTRLRSSTQAPRPVPMRWPKAQSALWWVAGLLALVLVAASVWRDETVVPSAQPLPVTPQPLNVTAGEALATGADPLDEGPASAPPSPSAEPAPVRGLVRDRHGPELIALNPATYRMGRSAGVAHSDGAPVREVVLPAFLIGSREVTFAEYDRFVTATGARRPSDHGFGRGKRPVIDVSWGDALAYTRWLSRRTGHRYRLPSEAEWEYAARAGGRSLHWWGADAPAGRAVCLDCGSRWDGRSTAPVASLAANPFGLYDTAGNVYEWVADCYQPTHRNAPSDGSALQLRGCRQRVARGGSFRTPLTSVYSHARRGFEPETRVDMIGFRIARDAR